MMPNLEKPVPHDQTDKLQITPTGRSTSPDRLLQLRRQHGYSPDGGQSSDRQVTSEAQRGTASDVECQSKRKEVAGNNKVDEQLKQMRQKIQKNIEKPEWGLTQWWEMQRKNRDQLNDILQKMKDSPEMQKQVSAQWWDMHREYKTQLDNKPDKSRKTLTVSQDK